MILEENQTIKTMVTSNSSLLNLCQIRSKAPNFSKNLRCINKSNKNNLTHSHRSHSKCHQVLSISRNLNHLSYQPLLSHKKNSLSNNQSHVCNYQRWQWHGAAMKDLLWCCQLLHFSRLQTILQKLVNSFQTLSLKTTSNMSRIPKIVTMQSHKMCKVHRQWTTTPSQERLVRRKSSRLLSKFVKMLLPTVNQLNLPFQTKLRVDRIA